MWEGRGNGHLLTNAMPIASIIDTEGNPKIGTANHSHKTDKVQPYVTVLTTIAAMINAIIPTQPVKSLFLFNSFLLNNNCLNFLTGPDSS